MALPALAGQSGGRSADRPLGGHCHGLRECRVLANKN
jgi:hypothetical protein